MANSSKEQSKITSTGPHVGSLLEQMGMSPGTWHVTINLANLFLPLSEGRWERIAFTWTGQQNLFAVLPQCYANSPNLCCNTWS